MRTLADIGGLVLSVELLAGCAASPRRRRRSRRASRPPPPSTRRAAARGCSASQSSAGQPVIKVRGQLAAEGRPLFAYEARRSGVSTSARMFGGSRGDKTIQEEDIKHLAKGLGDFIVRTTGP